MRTTQGERRGQRKRDQWWKGVFEGVVLCCCTARCIQGLGHNNLTRKKWAFFRGGARSCIARQSYASQASIPHWLRVVRRPCSVLYANVSGPETGKRKPVTRKVGIKLTLWVNLGGSWHEKLTFLVTHCSLPIAAYPFQGH